VRNYLLRLGWSHGDAETIATTQAIEWFNLEAIGKSPSRFDMAKLENINSHYLKEREDDTLAIELKPYLEIKLARTIQDSEIALLAKAMPGLKTRAKTLVELADNAAFYLVPRPIPLNEKAVEILSNDAKAILNQYLGVLEAISDFSTAKLEESTKIFAESINIKLGSVAQPLRAAITGSNQSPGMFEVMEVLGKTDVIARIRDVL